VTRVSGRYTVRCYGEIDGDGKLPHVNDCYVRDRHTDRAVSGSFEWYSQALNLAWRLNTGRDTVKDKTTAEVAADHKAGMLVLADYMRQIGSSMSLRERVSDLADQAIRIADDLNRPSVSEQFPIGAWVEIDATGSNGIGVQSSHGRVGRVIDHDTRDAEVKVEIYPATGGSAWFNASVLRETDDPHVAFPAGCVVRDRREVAKAQPAVAIVETHDRGGIRIRFERDGSIAYANPRDLERGRYVSVFEPIDRKSDAGD
jgi:hypothetical protein